MKNFVQKGDVLIVIAAAAISSGDIVKSGDLQGVAVSDAEIGEEVAVSICGVYELPKIASTAFTQGELLYFDVSANEVTNDSDTGTNIKIGYAFEAAGSADTTATVLLER